MNSAFYGFSAKVETVSRAVSLVGIAELRNMTLAMSAAEIFQDIPADLMDMVSFWRHSVFTGLVAKKLAAECHVLHGERLMTAGLLHDIGRLLIFMRLPEQGKAILDMLRGWGVNRFSVKWKKRAVRRLMEHLEEWGFEVNIYNVPDLNAFLRAVLMQPRSITSDFNFPQWNYFGRGNGERLQYHHYGLDAPRN